MAQAYEQGHPYQPAEECFLCGSLTGKAGAGEDSIYTDSGSHGPFCGDCWVAIGDDLNKSQDALAEAKAKLGVATTGLIHALTGGSEDEAADKCRGCGKTLQPDAISDWCRACGDARIDKKNR